LTDTPGSRGAADGTDATASTAATVAIGSELLGPLRLDTNSLWLTGRLEEIGIPVVRKALVGDDPDAIVRELERAAADANLVFTTGGLGPTADDVTVGAVARFLGAPVERNAEFAMAAQAAGIGFTELVQRIVDAALERHRPASPAKAAVAVTTTVDNCRDERGSSPAP